MMDVMFAWLMFIDDSRNNGGRISEGINLIHIHLVSCAGPVFPTK